MLIRLLCSLAISIVRSHEFPLYTYNDISVSLAVKPVVKTLDSLVEQRPYFDDWRYYFQYDIDEMGTKQAH